MEKNFLERFLKGFASTFLGQVISTLFHFASIMILTREISKVDFGIYTLIIVVSGFLLTISGLGLDLTLVKFMSGTDKMEGKVAFSKILLTRILSFILFTILFVWTAEFFLCIVDKKLMAYIFPISFLFVLWGLRDLFYRILQGLNYFKKYAITQSVSAALRLTLIFYFYLVGNLNLNNLILAEILCVVIVVLIGLIFIPFRRLYMRGSDKLTMKSLFKFSIPIYINNLASFSMTRLNLFIVGAMLNPVSVAYFDVGGKVADALKRASDSFILVFFPQLSNLISKGEKYQAEELITNSIKYAFLLIEIILLFSFLFRVEIITLLFSDKYIESSFVFFMLMINLGFGIVRNILGYSNLAAGFPKIPMKVDLISSAINIGGALLLIPQFGYVGVAYSLIVMNAFAQLAYLFYLKRIGFSIVFLKNIRSIILLSLVIGLYLLVGSESLSVKATCIVIYFTLSWFLNSNFRLFLKSTARFFINHRF
jgi:O-antigen/teichoic acid export membrane protein